MNIMIKLLVALYIVGTLIVSIPVHGIMGNVSPTCLCGTDPSIFDTNEFVNNLTYQGHYNSTSKWIFQPLEPLGLPNSTWEWLQQAPKPL